MLIVLESTAEIDVPALNPTPPITVEPEPFGIIFRSSFVLEALMLLSSMVTPGNTTAPVPEGFISMSAFDKVDLITLFSNRMCDSTDDLAYSSSKFAFILIPEIRNVSPEPSSAFAPISITC